jgi:hypothetical protein
LSSFIKIPDEIKEPDKFLRPIIHMAPYHNFLELKEPKKKIREKNIIDRLSNLVLGKKCNGLVTINAREALNLAFQDIISDKKQVISIITPSNSGYVSTCVTNEIEKFCKWQFGPNKKADAYILIHEFGRLAKLPKYLQKTDKPIIEDCAYSMTHKSIKNNYGKNGNYIIYSFSKSLGLQYGGALLFKNNKTENINSNISEVSKKYLLNYMDRNLKNLKFFSLQRKNIYKKMQKISKKYNLQESYACNKNELPQGFLVELKKNFDAEKIKTYMNSYGIESSIFYGGSAYFLPCHQKLTLFEINYMFYHLDKALEINNN